jgi:zona occludens toxin (predicted ATPase)
VITNSDSRLSKIDRQAKAADSPRGASDWGMLLVFVFVIALSFVTWAIYGHVSQNTASDTPAPTATTQSAPAPYPVNSVPPSPSTMTATPAQPATPTTSQE